MLNSVMTRRDILRASATGFGYLAFSALAQESSAATSPLAEKKPHFDAKVKRVIFMFMEGGPSHVDTFDYKPSLAKYAGKKPPYAQPKAGGTGHRDSLMQPSPYKFKQCGQSGLWISEVFPHLSKHADDLCLINGMHHATGQHEQGCVMMHTGEFRFSRPSMGSWIVYGLGAEAETLPAYMVVNPRERNTSNGCYSNGFLPAAYHATIMSNIGGRSKDSVAPIRNVTNPLYSTKSQRLQLELVQRMNQRYKKKQSDSRVDAVIESYERAFRMQSSVPQLLDLSKESAKTLALYGLNRKKATGFGMQCLLARRMAESGVRFIEISQGGWDHHDSLQKKMPGSARNIDQPIAGLISDLKQRGMWKDTLLVWGGEFGRTPAIEDMKDKQFGRDHNGAGFTGELGWFAEKDKVHPHDVHSTILHLLGLNHQKLTYRYGGRDYTLTDVDGQVIKDILA